MQSALRCSGSIGTLSMQCGLSCFRLFFCWAGDDMRGSKLHESGPGEMVVQLPSPTAWPVILAFGATLGALGLVTSLAVSVVGAVFVLAGVVGWFGQVLPREAHVSVPV